jgi:hypothetical protein
MIAAVVGAASVVGQDTGIKLIQAADALVAQVAELRGLEAKTAIEKGVSTKGDITNFLLERLEAEYGDKDIQREEWLLKKLGVIPEELDLKEFTVELLTEQVAGFYDPKRKKLFIADWLPMMLQQPTMVHELTHALQDQHYDLGRILESSRKLDNEDRILAQSAIIEGDAVAVMMDYMLKPMGRTFVQIDLALLMQLEDVNVPSQILKSAPEFLKAQLTFPYQYGAMFVHRVLATEESWAAVDRIYSDMPTTTEQILHPEKYLSDRDEPGSLDFEDPAEIMGDPWKVGYKNVFGEFALYLLLKARTTEGEAKAAAAGWDGDQIYIVENEGADQRAVFGWSLWDSEEDAVEFYVALKRWMLARFPVIEKPEDKATAFTLVQEGEHHSLHLEGTRVDYIIGLPSEQAHKFIH